MPVSRLFSVSFTKVRALFTNTVYEQWDDCLRTQVFTNTVFTNTVLTARCLRTVFTNSVYELVSFLSIPMLKFSIFNCRRSKKSKNWKLRISTSQASKFPCLPHQHISVTGKLESGLFGARFARAEHGNRNFRARFARPGMDPFWGGQNGENTRKTNGFGTFPAQKGYHFWTTFWITLFQKFEKV